MIHTGNIEKYYQPYTKTPTEFDNKTTKQLFGFYRLVLSFSVPFRSQSVCLSPSPHHTEVVPECEEEKPMLMLDAKKYCVASLV